ncbi:pirin family protein [Glycocaulis profundi]|nr:pirin family protein [Glycocaulis profundi]
MSAIEQVIDGRTKDLGGFQVSRVLPWARRRMVGPFVFLDEMGPAVFPPGQGVDVRPHPHIGLATVTYLFDGEMHHFDSLGSDQTVHPGDVNLMVAGRGISHSERTREEVRARGYSLHGIQTWIALPEADESVEPSFHHHPKADLPEFEHGGAALRLILGEAYGQRAPVKTFSGIVYIHAEMAPGARFDLPEGHDALAVYLVSGEAEVGGQRIEPGQLAVLNDGETAEMRSGAGGRAMILGGQDIGKRFIEWNFVASSKELIEKAKTDWRASAAGRWQGTVFILPPGEQEYIPLPGDPEEGPPEPSKECPTT